MRKNLWMLTLVSLSLALAAGVAQAQEESAVLNGGNLTGELFPDCYDDEECRFGSPTGPNRINGLRFFAHNDFENNIVLKTFDAAPVTAVSDSALMNFEHLMNGTAEYQSIGSFGPRYARTDIVGHSGQSASLLWPAESGLGIDAEVCYTFSGNGQVDVVFSVTPTENYWPNGWLGFMWASYLESARSRHIYFVGLDPDIGFGWASYGDDLQDWAEMGNIPYLLAKNLALDDDPPYPGAGNVREDPDYRFWAPFYFGIVDGDGNLETEEDPMLFLMMFDQKEPIRLGLWNWSLQTHKPAWDWQYIIRNPRVGKSYGYRARMIYRPLPADQNLLPAARAVAVDEYLKAHAEWYPRRRFERFLLRWLLERLPN